MRLLLPGIIVGFLGIILSFLLHNSEMIMYVLFVIGLVPIIISGFMTGAYVSGDRVRANYSDSLDFNDRLGMSSKLFLFGIPFILAAIAIYYIS